MCDTDQNGDTQKESSIVWGFMEGFIGYLETWQQEGLLYLKNLKKLDLKKLDGGKGPYKPKTESVCNAIKKQFKPIRN